MTYNHPFWDPPSRAEETAAWALVQKGLAAPEASDREKLYLAAVAALYKDAGAGSKSSRDQNYRDAMAAAYANYPDDETALFYGLSILGAIPEGSHGYEQQEQAAKIFDAVYTRRPDHPGVLHYLIHAYDDPAHADLLSKNITAHTEPSESYLRLGTRRASHGSTLQESDTRNSSPFGKPPIQTVPN